MNRCPLLLLLLCALCKAFYRRLEDTGAQCSLLVDSLTEGKYEDLVKPGFVISLERGGRIDLLCIPEAIENNPPDTNCIWERNAIILGRSLSYSYSFAKGRCVIDVDINPHLPIVTPQGSAYVNYTCRSSNVETGSQTTMTYLVYFLANGLQGVQPIMSEKFLERQVGKGSMANVTCDITIGLTSSVIQLNWYLVDENGENRRDVRHLAKHSVSMCTITRGEKRIEMVMTISNISEEMFNNRYQCIAEKIDVMPLYNGSIKTYRSSGILRSASLSDTAHHETLSPNLKISRLADLKFYANDSEDTCVQTSPCTVTMMYSLLPPGVIIEDIAVYVALAVVGITSLIIAAIIVYVYLKRVPIRSSLKHTWAITRDVADPDYEYQAAVFYAGDGSAEEEFVQGKLLIKLENRWKYKTCVPQRDYLIGSVTAQQYIDSLESSQKVIFLMTEGLFTNQWNIYALDVALKEHRRIIIIKTEDIDFQALLENYGKEFSDVESAMKVAAVIDWNRERYKWNRLHLEMPAIVTTSTKHRITHRLRELLKSLKRL